jgi:hypothetical protein
MAPLFPCQVAAAARQSGRRRACWQAGGARSPGPRECAPRTPEDYARRSPARPALAGRTPSVAAHHTAVAGCGTACRRLAVVALANGDLFACSRQACCGGGERRHGKALPARAASPTFRAANEMAPPDKTGPSLNGRPAPVMRTVLVAVRPQLLPAPGELERRPAPPRHRAASPPGPPPRATRFLRTTKIVSPDATDRRALACGRPWRTARRHPIVVGDYATHRAKYRRWRWFAAGADARDRTGPARVNQSGCGRCVTRRR